EVHHIAGGSNHAELEELRPVVRAPGAQVDAAQHPPRPLRGARAALLHGAHTAPPAIAAAVGATSSPKCPSTSSAASPSAHCARSAALAPSSPQKASGPSESPACREPWLPPGQWVTPPQSTSSWPWVAEIRMSPECGAVSAAQRRPSGSG